MNIYDEALQEEKVPLAGNGLVNVNLKKAHNLQEENNFNPHLCAVFLKDMALSNVLPFVALHNIIQMLSIKQDSSRLSIKMSLSIHTLLCGVAI